MITAAAVPGEQILLQYGPLGVLAVVLIVFARTAYKDLQARADRLETRNTALVDNLQDKIVPALVAATDAIRESATLLDELRRERESLISELRRRGADSTGSGR